MTKSCAVVAAGDLADDQEVALADPIGELAQRAAEVAGLLERQVLHRVEPEAVAVAERDPVLEAVDQRRQRVAAVEREILQREEVGALVLGVRVVEVAARRATPLPARV